MAVRLLGIIGNLLLGIGILLLLLIALFHADITYQRHAARGDSSLPLREPLTQIPQLRILPALRPEPFEPPRAISIAADPPVVTRDLPDHASTISRIRIPSIDVDSKVVEVGWHSEPQPDGTSMLVWQVAEYAVGHHRGSANPGEQQNIVLAGHVGGYGKVFRDLIEVQRGDAVLLTSNDQTYHYVVDEYMILDEEDVSAEQRAANARYIQPTHDGHEVVTLVTCWPPDGPDAFRQRIIVQARPLRPSPDLLPHTTSWSIR